MRSETLYYFTGEEEAVVHLLTELGIPRNGAAMLVFLARTREATSRTIERGAGLRQPEISVAAKQLETRGWITTRTAPAKGTGRRKKVYTLVYPLPEIVDGIEKEKIREADYRLSLLKKLRASL